MINKLSTHTNLYYVSIEDYLKIIDNFDKFVWPIEMYFLKQKYDSM